MQRSSPQLDFSSPYTLGWDIGGAHLKIAVLDQNGKLVVVEQYPCALWRGLDQLTPLITQILNKWTPIAQHAVTMSGEMVDLFSDRISGVKAIMHTFSKHVGAIPVQVFCAKNGLISLNELEGYEADIASANWLASATWAAQYFEYGIFLDIGSTTTDVLYFEGGRPAPTSIGDADRLISEELVYTGVTRTPLMALAQRITWRGATRGVMAELFATTADVYRILGSLPDDADQHDAVDGGEKTRSASISRMARMIGLDGHEYDDAAWLEIAGIWQSIQQALIQAALNRVQQKFQYSSYNAIYDDLSSTHATFPLTRSAIAATPAPPSKNRQSFPLVIAGVGRFLANGLINHGINHADFIKIEFGSVGNLIDPNQHDPMLADYASRCAPAVAVAALLFRPK